MILYKYVTPDRIDIIENSVIRFTQPDAFNDPFESFPSFAEFRKDLAPSVLRKPGMLEHAHILDSLPEDILRAIEDMAISQVPEQLGENFAFLCLTKNRNSLLMWAHYADSHRGFVIGFDSESNLFKPGPAKGIDGLRDVEYSDERWAIPEGGLAGLSFQEMIEANLKVFFRKSTEWAYEQEVRVVASPGAADKTLKLDNLPPIYLYKIPDNSIKEIILGYRMPNLTKKAVIGAVRAHHPGAKLYQAVLDGCHFQLQLDSTSEECVDFMEKLRSVVDPTTPPCA